MIKDMDQLIVECYRNIERHEANRKRTAIGSFVGASVIIVFLSLFWMTVGPNLDFREVGVEWLFLGVPPALILYFGLRLASFIDQWCENRSMPPVTPPRPWSKNDTGERPTGERVSVERENGDIQWNVCVQSLDWSLNVPNPIKSYLLKPVAKDFELPG